MKPEPIRITHFPQSDEPPIVVVPDELKDLVSIELIDGREADLLFLEHSGVRVYRTYWDEHISDCFYSTRPGVDARHDDDCFDVRDLPAIPREDSKSYAFLFSDDERQRVACAIDEGMIAEDGFNESAGS